MTDEFSNYDGLAKNYTHLVVNHLERYVQGNVHTQGIENFWSLLKRGLGGTYVSVEPFHSGSRGPRMAQPPCFRIRSTAGTGPDD